MKKVAFLFPSVVCFVIALRLVRAAQGLPAYDYWEIFGPLLAPGGLDVTWQALYARSNEHIVALTKLFYLLNYWLTGGDNLGLSVIACLFSLVIAFFLGSVFCARCTSAIDALMLGGALALFVFSPLGAHNYLLGMSGVAWLGANVFLAAAAFCMARAQSRQSHAAIACALALGLLGGQSYSTGLMILCAVGIQGCMLPQTRRAGIGLIVAGLAYILIVYALQVVPAKHGARSFDLLQISRFTLTLLGGGLTTSPSLAGATGGFGMIVFVWLTWHHATQGKSMPINAAFSIGLASYALMNAGVAAIGRSGMAGGEAIALASRYASLPSLFWIAVLGLALARCESIPGPANLHHRCMRRIAVAALVIALAMAVGARHRVHELLGRFAGNDAATLALALGANDAEAIDRYVTPDVDALLALAPMLRTIHHIPFNGALELCPRIGTRITLAQPVGDALGGYVDTAELLADGMWYRVRGWAMERDKTEPPLEDPGTLKAPACLALVDESGTVQGLAVGGMLRPDVAAAMHRDRADFGWQGYVRAQAGAASDSHRVHAAIQRQPSDPAWTLLPHSLVLPR